MNNYTMEIVAREWMRDQLQEAGNRQRIHEARLAAAAQAAADFPPDPRESRLALAGRRFGLAIRRVAGAGAAS